MFHKPKRRYNSEIVFSEDVNQGTVTERALTTDDRSEEDTEHQDEQDGENEGMGQQPNDFFSTLLCGYSAILMSLKRQDMLIWMKNLL